MSNPMCVRVRAQYLIFTEKLAQTNREVARIILKMGRTTLT